MKTLILKLDDSVSDKFLWLLQHFSQNEVSIVDADDFILDDVYLRSIDGMADSIHKARSEADSDGVALSQLDW